MMVGIEYEGGVFFGVRMSMQWMFEFVRRLGCWGELSMVMEVGTTTSNKLAQ